MSGNPYQPPVGELPPDHWIRPEVGRGQAIASSVLLIAGDLGFKHRHGDVQSGIRGVGHHRERWFHVIGMFVFLLQLGTLPMDTPTGILMLFGGVLRWKGFYSPSSRPENPSC